MPFTYQNRYTGATTMDEETAILWARLGDDVIVTLHGIFIAQLGSWMYDDHGLLS